MTAKISKLSQRFFFDLIREISDALCIIIWDVKPYRLVEIHRLCEKSTNHTFRAEEYAMQATSRERNVLPLTSEKKSKPKYASKTRTKKKSELSLLSASCRVTTLTLKMEAMCS
jgi:hypothetical protein